MNKIIGVVSSIVLSFCAEATLTIKAYKRNMSKFTPSTDLIYGNILLSSGLLEKWRSNGDIKFNSNSKAKPAERNSGNMHSFTDFSDNAMTDLLIQLFPSAGPDFTVDGAGSLKTLMLNVKGNHLDLIVGMFKIAEDVRTNRTQSEIFEKINNYKTETKKNKAAFIKKYFCISTGSGCPAQRLFRLIKNVANAVLLEEETSVQAKTTAYKKTHPYPAFFTNNLICAYVWQALSDDSDDTELKTLIEKLGCKDASNSNPFSNAVVEDAFPTSVSLVPYYPGTWLISNTEAEYNGFKFPDCVETAVRHFFCTLFCSLKGDGSNELFLDTTRIPVKSKLMDFFAPQAGKDIFSLANDGTKEIRDAWAKVVSGFNNEGIIYSSNDCEVHGGWENTIKLICLLLDGYSAGPTNADDETDVYLRKKAAEDIIKKVNEERKANTFKLSVDNTIDIINKLLGIRTDIKLVAKNGSLEFLKESVSGDVLICPERHTEHQLQFSNWPGHGRVTLVSNNYSKTLSITPSYWIEELYKDNNSAIRGDMIIGNEHEYMKLSEARYPILEYYLRMTEEIGLNYLMKTRIEKLKDKEYIESIARLFYSDDTLDLLGFITTAQKAKVPKENIITLCAFIAHNALSPWHTSVAVSFLQKNDLSKIEDFKSEPISKDSLIVDFMVQICNFENYIAIKQALIEKLKNGNDKTLGEVGDLFVCIGKSFEKYLQKFFLFDVDILNSLLPHIKRVTEKLEAFEELQSSYKPASDIVSILDLVDFNNALDVETSNVLSRFVKSVRNKLSSPVFNLKLSFYRSDEKLKFLLPVCRIDDERLAKQIFETYTGNFSPETVSAFVAKMSESDIKVLIAKQQQMIGVSSVDLTKALFWWRRGDINISFMESITEKYGKFTSAEAKELMIFLKRPTVVIPFIKSGEKLPHEAVVFLGYCQNDWQLCEMINYIYENNISMPFPDNEEALLEKILSASIGQKMYLSVFFDNMLTNNRLSMDLIAPYLKCFWTPSIYKNVFNHISHDGVIPTDAIKTFLKHHVRVNRLLVVLSREKYKIHKDAAIELICGIEWDENSEYDNISTFYKIYMQKALSLLLDEDKMFSREDIGKLCLSLREKQNQLENLEYDLLDGPQCIDFEECINLIKEHCNQNDIPYLEEKFNTCLGKE